MAKFNPGDRVRPKPGSPTFDEVTEMYGAEGVIAVDDGDYTLPLYVDWGDNDPTWFDYHEVELVESAGV